MLSKTKSSRRECRIIIDDEVNARVEGLHPTDCTVLYNRYGMFAPNHFFHPKFKLGMWDGKIRFFQQSGKCLTYFIEGMIPELLKMNYKPEIIDKRKGPYVNAQPIHKDVFAHVISPKTGLPMELRYYQVDAVNALMEEGKGLISAATSAGKAQPLTSKVLTPTGWKLMGDIAVDDVVTIPKGGTTRVVGVFPQGKKMINKITFDDGSSVEACNEHLWSANVPINKGAIDTKIRVVDTQYIKDWTNSRTRRKISLPLVAPVEFDPIVLPMDPYLLGALLGDGGFTHDQISFTNIDPKIVYQVGQLVNDYDTTLKTVNGKDYYITKATGREGLRENHLISTIRELGLMNRTSSSKFVPEQYKRGSIMARWMVLQGLFDTDGTIDLRGNVSYTTTSPQLAKDVQAIIWSLGAKCTITSRRPTYPYKGEQHLGQEAFMLHVQHDDTRMFFTVPRKLERCKVRTKYRAYRTIVSVEEIGEQEAQCIMVEDTDHLYITDNFVVTHNTWINAALVNAYGVKGLKTITIVPSTSLVIQTIADFRAAGLDVGEYSGKSKDLEHLHIVSTWQAIKNHPHLMALFQVVVVDEVHQAKSKILNELVNVHGANIPYRFGLTGTLPKDEVERLTIHTAFGDVKYTLPASELMDQGFVSTVEVSIEQMFENHPDGYFPDYTAEKSYLNTRKERTEWMADRIIEKRNLPLGNSLVLVSSIAMGKKLQKLIPNSIFLNGADDADSRKTEYDKFATQNDMVVIATVQIAGTGLSIDRIFHLFLIDIGKSFTRVIQAIGRSLRMGADKNHAYVYDICSNLKYSKKHLLVRVQYYKEAKYPFVRKVVKYRDYNDKFVGNSQDVLLSQLEADISLDY